MKLHRRQHAEALTAADWAIGLAPNEADGYGCKAYSLTMSGKPEVAIDFVRRAMRLDPLSRVGFRLWQLSLAYLAMGRLQEAVTYSRRALTYNPEIHMFAIPLAVALAQMGQENEARVTCKQYRWDAPNLQSLMYFLPFQEPDVADRVARGLIRAGVPGQPPGYDKYYRASGEHQLKGEEIRGVTFGRTTTGFDWWTGKQWWVDYSEDGKLTRRGAGGSASGKGWIEGDMLCQQWENLSDDLMDCAAVYRNPDGEFKMRNEYFSLSDTGMHPFSPVE
jgi:tetratricopeptide (TPR) repeat protein